MSDDVKCASCGKTWDSYTVPRGFEHICPEDRRALQAEVERLRAKLASALADNQMLREALEGSKEQEALREIASLGDVNCDEGPIIALRALEGDAALEEEA